MNEDIDDLIRSAKPAIPAGVRARTLEYAEPEGAVGSSPAFVRVLLRVAALLLLAVCSGVVAAMLSAPSQDTAEPVELAAELADARGRMDSLELDSPAKRIESLEAELASLEAHQRRAEEAFEQAVIRAMDTHERNQMAEWRERHIQHVREHQAIERDTVIAQLREDLNLTSDQEQEVRALLVAADKQAEVVIGEFYTNRHGRHDPRMREKFEKLAEDAEQKLTALLDAQQRDRIEEPTGIVSANPDDWAPNFEFHDGTDMDVYTNWITVTRD